jgi:sialidase-1
MVKRRCFFSALVAVACTADVHAAKAEEAPRLASAITKVELFRAGEAGYRTYRIPALAITRKGTLLAAVAARFDGHGDWSNTDIMFRRSTDGGKTWDAQRTIADDGTNTVDNPTFIIDPQSDTIYLMYQINYARAYLKRSTDEGVTWSPPQEITAAFEEFRDRDGYNWEVLAMGPGHGIRLSNGRLLVPVWLSTSHKHRPSISSTVYSDDHGATWHAGEVIASTTESTPNPSEHMLIELGDGRVMANIRTEAKTHRRLVSLSPNGSADWSEPRFDEALYEPICMASLIRTCASVDSTQPCTVLFSNPDSSQAPGAGSTTWGAKERRNLTVRLSHDEGQTWPVSQVIEPGPSGYSDMAVAADGTVHVLYENGSVDSRGAFIPSSITLASFPIGILSVESTAR